MPNTSKSNKKTQLEKKKGVSIAPKRIYAPTAFNDFIENSVSLKQLLKLIKKDAEKRLGPKATLTSYLDHLTQFQLEDRKTIQQEAENDLIELLDKLNGVHLLSPDTIAPSVSQLNDQETKKTIQKQDQGTIVNRQTPNNQVSSDLSEKEENIIEVPESVSESEKIVSEPVANSNTDATKAEIPSEFNSLDSENHVSDNQSLTSSKHDQKDLSDSDHNYEEVQIDDLADGSKALNAFFAADSK